WAWTSMMGVAGAIAPKPPTGYPTRPGQRQRAAALLPRPARPSGSWPGETSPVGHFRVFDEAARCWPARPASSSPASLSPTARPRPRVPARGHSPGLPVVVGTIRRDGGSPAESLVLPDCRLDWRSFRLTLAGIAGFNSADLQAWRQRGVLEDLSGLVRRGDSRRGDLALDHARRQTGRPGLLPHLGLLHGADTLGQV